MKRMLNAMSLRKQLAAIAKISIKEEMLAKLMVLEYSNLPLFQELNQWQAAEKGVPSKLKTLETEALKGEDDSETLHRKMAWQNGELLRLFPGCA